MSDFQIYYELSTPGVGQWLPLVIGLLILILLIYLFGYKTKQFGSSHKRVFLYVIIGYVIYYSMISYYLISYFYVYNLFENKKYLTVTGPIENIVKTYDFVNEMTIGTIKFKFERGRGYCLIPYLKDKHPFTMGRQVSVDFVKVLGYNCVVRWKLIN